MKKNETKSYVKSLDLTVVKKKDVEDKISIENGYCGSIARNYEACSTIPTQFEARLFNRPHIDYSQYLAENLDAVISYSEYLAKSLDRVIVYSEYLSKNLK